MAENLLEFFEVGINSVCTSSAYRHISPSYINHSKLPSTANIVLQSTVERIFVAPPTPSSPGASTQPGLYADIPRGLFLVRGENVLLLGEIDLDKDDDAPPGYEKADAELVHKLAKEKSVRDSKKDKNRLKKLAELGFEGENSGEAIFG